MDDDEQQEMDAAIFAMLSSSWRKQAYVIGYAIINQPTGRKWRDTVVSERIQALVKAGAIDGVGDLSRMRFSEIRLPQDPAA